MKVAELLERRKANWHELEQLCDVVKKRKPSAVQVSRFATLYRAACADLALADAYQLPPNTVQYLHRLVGQVHNQLYRAKRFAFATWTHVLLVEVPQRIFRDGCVQLVFVLFWAIFLGSAFISASPEIWPDYAEQVLTPEQIQKMQSDFGQPISRKSANAAAQMAGFYIWHNTTIGLKCFAGGLLVIPGLFITVFNAAMLGAVFGFMSRPGIAAGENFFEFVTAHGPFELTAIVLSAGAGLRLGMSWIVTNGMQRSASLHIAAKESMPLMGAAMVLFFLAALIEAFISPSGYIPYSVKISVAVISSGILLFYFLVLGFPRRQQHAV